MCGYDADCPTATLEDGWRKARKEHKCCACHEMIRKGDHYHFLAGIWDGESFARFKHCARCWAILRALWAADAEPELHLDCGETWESALEGPVPEEVARLAFLTPDEAQALVEDPA